MRKTELVALILIAGFVALAGQTAFAADKIPFIGKPMFTVKKPDAKTMAKINALSSSNAPLTIPSFAHSYFLTFDNTTRWYRMVGHDPANAANNNTTTVPTTIYPLAITFAVDQTGAANPFTLDGNNQLTNVENSPIFATADYISGTGLQYGDAIQRGSLWNFVTATTPNWHTNLGGPAVGPTQSFTVPSTAGFWINLPGVPPIGLIDNGFFNSQLVPILIGTAPDPQGLPIYLSDNVFLFFGNPNACCVLGFHSAFTGVGPANSLNTFIWDSWIAPGIFNGGFQDITGLSHETSEWFADPFINNGTPEWTMPPNTTCIVGGKNDNRFNGILEVGDVVEGLPNPTFQVTTNGVTYNPEDEALVSFFTQDVPSQGINGQYTFTNELSSPAAYCKTH